MDNVKQQRSSPKLRARRSRSSNNGMLCAESSGPGNVKAIGNSQKAPRLGRVKRQRSMPSVSRSSSGVVIVRTEDPSGLLLRQRLPRSTWVRVEAPYAVTWEIAQFGGRLDNNWRSK